MSNINEIREKFLQFYQRRGHVKIPSSSLLPENDASTLFTSSGMQPLIQYFLGTQHPEGKRICDAQKCFRAVDIEEVGDNRHTTFFEMLGNWSFGDYFKAEQIPQVFEFFTEVVGLDPKRLYVTVFAGDETLGLARDDESIKIWQEVFAKKGIEAKVGERIFAYDASKNWWSRSGTPDKMPAGEPGGADSEIFYDFGEERHLHENSPWKNEPCHPNCDCGRFIEIGNSVFMQYQKLEDGKFADLPAKNVDYGGGLERAIMAAENQDDIFQTSVFQPIIKVLERATKSSYLDLDETKKRAWRIIADHVRSAVFLAAEGLEPTNKEQGYVLRRLIRRTLVQMRQAEIDYLILGKLVAPIVEQYAQTYPDLSNNKDKIMATLQKEAKKFTTNLQKGLKLIEKMDELTGESAFLLYESYGFPLEITQEIAARRGLSVDKATFEAARAAHREQSRAGATKKFRGGLVDHSDETVKFHTAAHLLNAALKKLIDPNIVQKGSNITGERARFDFTLNRALTPEEILQLQTLVNEWIEADLPVSREEHPKAEALEIVGGSVFEDRYPEMVSLYRIGDVSVEICVGPHVEHTALIGSVQIKKQQSAGSGIRRLYIYPLTK